MLRIEAIKISIYTSTGEFGRSIKFSKGLNIVRANNTSGKSSLFGAIIYALGFEELLGGRNEKAMQSLFKSIIKEKTGQNAESILESTVTQSSIFLQINNGILSNTIKRNVIHGSVKPQAIEVYNGAVLTAPDTIVDRQSMYVHDSGGASNSDVGFHMYLEEFLGLKLPEIVNQEGKRVKLYLPLIASAHFIEQKSGWSDFFANTPFYGVRDTPAKVFEFVMNLSVFGTAAKRQEIQNELRSVEDKWKVDRDKLAAAVKRGGGELIGLPETAEILSETIKPFARFFRGEEAVSLRQLITSLNDELQNVLSEIDGPMSEKTESIERQLSALREENEGYEVLFESLHSELNHDKERYRQYTAELRNVREDLRKNKDAQKIEQLGLEANLKLGTGTCPTCGQSVANSLLNPAVEIVPMRIDENIAYLNAQNQMIDAFVRNIGENIKDKESRLASIESTIQSNRQRIRSMKRDLISDDRLPSMETIERKILLDRELSFYYKLSDEIDERISGIYILSKDYEIAKGKFAKLSQQYHTIGDLKKIEYFQTSFKTMLENFGFTSKPVSTITISSEKYLPVYEIMHSNGQKRFIDIRFESSASDFIRAQWAYYTSLMKTAIFNGGNHFGLLLMDEPQQQSASNVHFREFLRELEKYRDEQVIVLASFQDSEDDFNETTDGLVNYNVVDLATEDELLVKRIEQAPPRTQLGLFE